eukprot:9376315-Alexandrium_andersonii.AAC.1
MVEQPAARLPDSPGAEAARAPPGPWGKPASPEPPASERQPGNSPLALGLAQPVAASMTPRPCSNSACSRHSNATRKPAV